jgi:hypothetical protein
MGSRTRGHHSSRFRGVSWHRGRRAWQAQLSVNGRRLYLGLHQDELGAALTYDLAARKHHGRSARLNAVYAANALDRAWLQHELTARPVPEIRRRPRSTSSPGNAA